jgi:branched-chain amino acid transport system ATP-binding protein
MLELQGICVDFGGLRAVDEVSLRIAPGARHALIGANGAGKSTLLHVAAGAIAPSAGRVLLGDREVTGWAPHRRAQAGLGRTFQQPALLHRQTCLSNVATALWRRNGGAFALLTRPARRRAVAEEGHQLLADVGLSTQAGRVSGQLSHAQQRQLEFAVALAGRPELLLLDEPAAGLARPDLARLRDLIRALPATLTVLLVDHDLDLVFDLASTVTVLDRGRVLVTGSPAAVRADPRAAEVYLGPVMPAARGDSASPARSETAWTDLPVGVPDWADPDVAPESTVDSIRSGRAVAARGVVDRGVVERAGATQPGAFTPVPVRSADDTVPVARGRQHRAR